MEPSSSSSTLNISGMTGQPCVDRVRLALHGVSGVGTESVCVGSAVITAEKPDQRLAACAALSAIGFKTTETRGPFGADDRIEAAAKPAPVAESLTGTPPGPSIERTVGSGARQPPAGGTRPLTPSGGNAATS